MKFRNLALILAVSCGLSGCSWTQQNVLGGRSKYDPEQDFKPYVANEMHALPKAYPVESWAYPEGTPTAEIVKRWRLARLIMGVRTRAATEVLAGPQFYNLSYASQCGLADAVAQMYNAGSYRLIDYNTKKVVGNYTPIGLQLY